MAYSLDSLIDPAAVYTAELENLLTRDRVRVHSTVDHACSHYGIPVWVDDTGNCYGQINLPLMGYDIVSLDALPQSTEAQS